MNKNKGFPLPWGGVRGGLLLLLMLLPLCGYAQTLEYWFDDQFAQRTTTTIASTDAMQELELDLRDNAKFPTGFHTLNMRVTIGGKPSAVYSSGVLKLAAGKISKLEYWLDDDLAHSKTIGGKESTDGTQFQFLDSLDLTDATPGYHLLHCRAVSNSGKTASAVITTPIMVKSLYNVGNSETLTVAEQAYWLDDEEPEIISVTNPENLLKRQHTLDARHLSDGKHTVHMQFKNSAGIWSGPVSQTFTKTKIEAPKITANASVKDGVVTLNYNAVPYALNYSIVRQYPSGTVRRVDVNKSTQYPADLLSTDTPAPGTYTYYVEGKYLDADGERQSVRSNEISVNVEKAASSVKKSRFRAVLKKDGKKLEINDYQIFINGKPHYGGISQFGSFSIEGLTIGEEITIALKSRYYNFKDMTLLVDENTKNNTYIFEATKKEDEVLPDNSTYDLLLTKNIQITSSAFELEVKNLSNKLWSGNIIVRIINKKEKDKFDKFLNGEFSTWDKIGNVFNPKSSYENVPLYTTASETHVQIGGKDKKVLSLNITDLPEKDKFEAYYVYVFSKKDKSGQIKELDDGGYESYRNPHTLEFNPFGTYVAQEKDFKDYVEDYKTILRYLKKMSDWGDPFAQDIKSIKNFDEYVENLDYGLIDGIGVMQDQLSGVFLLSFYLSDVNKTIKRSAKSATNSLNLANGIVKIYDRLEGFYNANQVDDYHKFFTTAKEVSKLCKTLNLSDYPALRIYQTYLDVGEKMVDAIKGFEQSIHGSEQYERLIGGKGIYKIKVRKYTADGSLQYFSPSDVYKQIKSFGIRLTTETGYETEGHSFDVDLEEGKEITIKNVDFLNNNNTLYTKPEIWLTITWKNNRVTYVPMYDEQFVKIKNKNSKNEPLIMTVELQSGTYMNLERIANQLTFVKP